MPTDIAIIRIRRDTIANWTSVNPTLALGEISYDLTNHQIRVGDGTNAWLDLPVIGSSIIADGDKGDIVISGGGTTWSLDSALMTLINNKLDSGPLDGGSAPSLDQQIQIRRDITVNWVGTILNAGEIGYDSSLNEIRIGNGTAVWENLDPIGMPKLPALSITQLNDVEFPDTAPAEGEVLTFDETAGLWVNRVIPTPSLTLNDLTTVTLTAPQNTEILQFNGTQWVNAPGPVAGTTIPLGVKNEIEVVGQNDWQIVAGTIEPIALDVTQTFVEDRLGQPGWFATLDAVDVTVPVEQLGTGTPSTTTVLHGDGTWAEPTITQDNLNLALPVNPQDAATKDYTDAVVGLAIAANVIEELDQANGIAVLNSSRVVAKERLATGTADATKYLKGDGTWATLSIDAMTDVTLGTPIGGDILQWSSGGGGAFVPVNRDSYLSGHTQGLTTITIPAPQQVSGRLLWWNNDSLQLRTVTLTDSGLATVTHDNTTNEINVDVPSSHPHALSDLTVSGASTGSVAAWNGTNWVPAEFTDGNSISASYNNGTELFSFNLTQGDKGDITVNGDNTWTIDPGVVTMQNLAFNNSFMTQPLDIMWGHQYYFTDGTTTGSFVTSVGTEPNPTNGNVVLTGNSIQLITNANLNASVARFRHMDRGKGVAAGTFRPFSNTRAMLQAKVSYTGSSDSGTFAFVGFTATHNLQDQVYVAFVCNGTTNWFCKVRDDFIGTEVVDVSVDSGIPVASEATLRVEVTPTGFILSQITLDSFGDEVATVKLDYVRTGLEADVGTYGGCEIRSRGTSSPAQTLTVKEMFLHIGNEYKDLAPLDHTHALADLEQGGATSGQVIKWNGSAWAAADDATGGAGSVALNDLTDVTLTSPIVNDLLILGAGNIWINSTRDSWLNGHTQPLSTITVPVPLQASGKLIWWNNDSLQTRTVTLGGTGLASISHDNTANTITVDVPASHTHAQSDITNLVTDLAGKASTSHTHSAADITTGSLALARIAQGGATAGQVLKWNNISAVWEPGTDNTGGSASPGGSDRQVQFNDSNLVIAGASQVEIEAGGNLKLIKPSSAPSAPAADSLVVYPLDLGGKDLLAYTDSSGYATNLQHCLSRNNIRWWKACTASAQASADVGADFVTTGTMTAATISSANFQASCGRVALVATATTAQTEVDLRINGLQCFRGDGTNNNRGGFFFNCRFGFNDSVGATTTQFAGLNSQNAVTNIADASPDHSSLPDAIGVCKRNGDTNWFIQHRAGTAASTFTDTGIAISSTTMYDLVVYTPPNGSTIHFRFEDLETGTAFNYSTSSNIPTNTQTLTGHAWRSNGATTGSVNMQLSVMYLETKF